MDVPRSGAARADGTYDMLRLMLKLHVGKLTSNRWTTSENLAVIDAENQAIWPQIVRRKMMCATIVNGRGR